MKIKHCRLIVAVVALEILEISFCLGEPITFADFEQNDWGKWTMEGSAFGSDPCTFNETPLTDTSVPIQTLSNFTGKGLANSYNNNKGDLYTGKLTSPEFKIEKPFITFLVGGGYDPERQCLHLVVEGERVRTETGHNNDLLRRSEWDVRELIGKTASIEIVDDSKSPWGHIAVDEIQFTDTSFFPKTLASPPVFADFESFTWEKWVAAGWKVEGKAFGPGPMTAGIKSVQKLGGYEGEAVVSSFALGTDMMKGKLISPEFKIEKPVITFLLGGGNSPDQIAIRLVIDGKEVQTTTGNNSDILRPKTWNVSEFIGKTAIIEIVDESVDPWGHIVVDHIQFGD